jgi:hypothetical protein
MTKSHESSSRRIEEFRSDLTSDAIARGRLRHARSVAALAYLHGLPAFLHLRQLTEFLQGRAYFEPDAQPLGGWVFMRDLATPEVTTVSPNVDTLYAASYLLLDRQGPVVLDVPAIESRYYSVALQDAYFSNFAIVGPRTFGNGGGRYLIVPPAWDGKVPGDIAATFRAPTPSVFLVQRIFVQGPSEVEELRRLQDEIRLSPLGGDSFAPVDLTEFELENVRTTSDPLRFFELVNSYTGLNPPSSRNDTLMEIFRGVGVGPGSTLPDDAALLEALAEGAGDAQSLLDAHVSAGEVRNGWKVPLRGAGTAEQGILDRAVTQLTAMGSNPLDEAIYFFAYRDGDGQPLDGANRYRLRFEGGALPELAPLGFWSLTMYGPNALLVANPIDRYVLRPDAGLRTGADGSLTLAVQATPPDDVPPENWLPSPAEGAFNICLRTYLPTQGIVSGTWFPPPLVRSEGLS